jgi:Zn-dependent peptidase ImmA (M78 family)
MSSINDKELFEKYYQNEYDYNTTSLTNDDIEKIKRLVKEKRVDYAQAPIGTGIFAWILKQNKNLRFELVSFGSEKIDGMLYIPTAGKEKAYIVLNSTKPLINQVFAAAHEFYHYIEDYKKPGETAYVCDFSMLKDVNEKKACRFAAELLLPEDALQQDCKAMDLIDSGKTDFTAWASLIMCLTIKYQMPLKAVIYRLAEEKYISDVDEYIRNYEFMKSVLMNIQIFEKRVKELYAFENPFVMPYSSTYQDMKKAFVTGNASREDILEDAQKLNLDMSIIEEMIADEGVDGSGDEELDDAELISLINEKWGH